MSTPRQRKLALLLVLAAFVGAAFTATPAGAFSNPVINDCANTGKLNHTFTLAELRRARATLPSSVKEYTNCYDVISQAIVSALKTGTFTGGSGKSSGGSFLPTPVIVILVVLILAAITFGAIAIRRRRGVESGGPGSSGTGSGSSGPPGPGGPPAT